MELNERIIKELESKGYKIIPWTDYTTLVPWPWHKFPDFQHKHNYNGKCIIKYTGKCICIYSIPYLIKRGELNGNCTDNNS